VVNNKVKKSVCLYRWQHLYFVASEDLDICAEYGTDVCC